MSTIDDIRAAMAAAAGPVKPAEIAETLELDPKAVRSAMYQAAVQGAGIEKDDDGSYSLIPGWKPRARGAESESAADPAPQDAAPPVRKPRKAAENAKKPRAARAPKAAREPREAVAKKRTPRKLKPAPAVRRRAPRADGSAATPAVSDAPIAHFHTILLPRQTVRLLVAGVLAFGGVLGDELRAAVLEATKEAA